MLMYEVRSQKYDPEIHEEYLIHDTPLHSSATSFIAMYRLAIKHNCYTQRQQCSAELSPKSGFLRFS